MRDVEGRIWSLVAACCCVPLLWALLSDAPPLYPHLQQFCFGSLASIATAKTVLGFPKHLMKGQMTIAWLICAALLALLLLGGLGALRVRFPALLVPVVLIAPVLTVRNRVCAKR